MRMSDPDFWNSPDTAKAVSQEATKLKEEVQGHDDLVNEAADLSELYDLAAEDEDTSFTGEIERQYYRLVKELEKREVLLLLSGEYDSCNAIMAFHAGAGGTEAQDWTQMIVRMYSRWAEQHGYTIRMIDYQPGDEAGTKRSSSYVFYGCRRHARVAGRCGSGNKYGRCTCRLFPCFRRRRTAC